MFRYRKGRIRSFKHNLQIASILSFVAGMVNVTGFLSVQELTTNVTGHFAFFVDEVFKFNFIKGFVILLFVLFFLLGSFVSSFILEFMYKKRNIYLYIIPAIMEAIILFFVALWGQNLIKLRPEYLAYLLLFSMGLQNSLVTSVSNSKVKTTHLTGLFTDLGIELSQLFFYKEPTQNKQLKLSIQLRLAIICFFFLGGFTAGVFYTKLQLKVLMIAGTILLSGTTYDYIKLYLILLRRKYKYRNFRQ